MSGPFGYKRCAPARGLSLARRPRERFVCVFVCGVVLETRRERWASLVGAIWGVAGSRLTQLGTSAAIRASGMEAMAAAGQAGGRSGVARSV